MGLTTGTRLRAQNSACEVVVIKGADAELTCAGLPMLPDAEASVSAVEEGPAIELGKRYVDDAETLEVLCVRPGIGPLAVGGRALGPKTAKPLPSSD